MDNKVVKYALIGGAAIIAAALAFHYAGKSSSATGEADIDDYIEELGDPEYDENGFLKFDFFIKIFQISS